MLDKLKCLLNLLTQHSQAFSVLVSAASVVVTAGVGISAYSNENALKKVERSLEYSYEYRSGRILDAREQLQILYDQLVKHADNENLTDLQKKYLIYDSFKESRNKINYGLLIGLFSAAYKCLELLACDRDTLDYLMSNGACQLILKFYWKVESDTNKDREFTQGLLYFAGKYREGECVRSLLKNSE